MILNIIILTGSNELQQHGEVISNRIKASDHVINTLASSHVNYEVNIHEESVDLDNMVWIVAKQGARSSMDDFLLQHLMEKEEENNSYYGFTFFIIPISISSSNSSLMKTEISIGKYNHGWMYFEMESLYDFSSSTANTTSRRLDTMLSSIVKVILI